jgi:hypothetical protein
LLIWTCGKSVKLLENPSERMYVIAGGRLVSKDKAKWDMCMQQTYKSERGKGDECGVVVEKAGVEGR